MARVFWWRVADNLFRRIVWYLLPVVLFAIVGVVRAGLIHGDYESRATLRATSNPFVPETGGVTAESSFESPATAFARVIGEQLSTDNFASTVAQSAGLGTALDADLISLDDVRLKIGASAEGASLFSVTANWTDPQTAAQLVAAAIESFSEFLKETVSSDAATAEAFYSERLQTLTAERAEAERAYQEFVTQLPPLAPGAEHGFDVQIQAGRYQSALERADQRIADAQNALNDAQISRIQIESEAGQTLKVVDPPSIPFAPLSTTGERVVSVAAFMMLGAVVSALVLLLTTAADRTVNAPAELLGGHGVQLVATIGRGRGDRSMGTALGVARRLARGRS